MRKIEVSARLFRAGMVTCARAAPEEGEDGRTVELTFSSEEPVERFYGWEILGHGPGEVELGRIASGSAPLLMDHRNDLDHQVGVVVSAAVENGRGRAVVRFGGSSRAAELLARVREGEVSSVSVGYRIKKLSHAGERDGEPVYRATAWEPLEISLVAVPADASVGVGRADAREGDTISLSVEGDMPNPNPTPEAEARANPTPAPAAPRAEDVLAQERGRVAAIRATADQFDLPAEMVRRAEAEGTTPEAFQRAVLDHLAAGNQAEVNAGAARIGLSEREVQRFSFLRAIAYLANPNDRRAREAAGFEREVSEAAAQALGRTAQGLMVPEDVLRQSMRASDQVVGTATAGGATVDEVLLSGSFIDILRNTAILPRLGVRTLAGLTGDIAIPKQTGASTAYWVGEDGAPTNSGVAFGQVKMTPHTVGAITQLSRKLLIQSSVDVEAMVRGDIAAQIALAIDHAGLNGNADTDAPDGLADAVGINTVDLATAGSPPSPRWWRCGARWPRATPPWGRWPTPRPRPSWNT